MRREIAGAPVVLDRAPKEPGPLGVTADACDTRKHADTKDASAVIVQLPAPVMCTVLPETVQLPDAVKLTGKFDDEVALTLKSGAP